MNAPRLDLTTLAPASAQAMLALEQSLTLQPRLKELVKLRVSQINGCWYCIDMHWRELRALGEPEERLYSLDAWRESTAYSEPERAALALAEAITLVTEGHVPDHIWEQAAAAFSPHDLAQLVFTITTINAWNRLMITVRMPAPQAPPRTDGRPQQEGAA